MSRISDIFTVRTSTDTYEILNPLSEYINVDASINKITNENIEDTIDSLFYMQAGENTPFTSVIRTFSSSPDENLTYPATTYIGIAQSNNSTRYYNDELSWQYSSSGYGTRYLDDDKENYNNYVPWKTSFPDSNILGGRPISKVNYKSIRITPQVHYMTKTGTPNPTYNYATPYYFLSNYKANDWVITGISLNSYSPVPSTSIMYSQKIKTDDPSQGGLVRTFCVPYKGISFPRIDFYKSSAHRYFLDYSNTEYFDEPIHYGTGRFDIVYPLKPEKLFNFLVSFGYILEGNFTKDDTQRFYPIVNNGIISGDYVEKLEDWKSDNSKWEDTSELDRPDPSANVEELAKQPLNPYALSERFFNRYLLTAQEMIDLKTALDGETLQELNAIQYVVNLCIVPDGLDTYYASAPTNEIYFGKTAVNLPARKVLGATSIVDLGYVDITRKYNNFLDYEPYTKVTLYIPFCGKVSLPTDKVMGNQIHVQVAFDYLDGNCTAYVYMGDSLITTATGNFYCSVPLSQDASMSKDMEFMFSAINWIGQSVGSVGIGLATQNPAIAIGGAISSTANFGNSLHDITAKSDTNIVQGSGNLNGFNAPMQCCVYYERPDVEVPKLFGEINGYACHESGQLKEFHGFTSCSDFHLDGIVCTKIEKEMLDELLRKGVILD